MSTNKPELVESGVAYEKTGLVHRVRQPETGSAHPTVVMLQGRMGTEDVMWVFARTLPKDWLLIAPRAPLSEGDGFSWHPPKLDSWPDVGMFADGVEAVHQLILALPSLYKADLTNLYLMGFSQGAALSYAYTVQYSHLVQGIAALVGFMPLHVPVGQAQDAFLDKPVFVAAGTKDETIPLELSRQSKTFLQTAGADVTYGEYETGHKLNSQGIKALTAWWDEQQ